MQVVSKMKVLSLFLSFSAAFILTGCGGGGGGGGSAVMPTYSGVTTPATIDSSNAEAIGTTSTEAAIQLISGDNAQDANPFGISITNNTSFFTDTMPDLVKNIIDDMQNSNLPVGVTLGANYFISTPGYCGGTITVPNSFDLNATTFSIGMTFSNFCFDDGVQQATLSGTINISVTPSTMVSTYISFSVTISGVTETINMSISCTDGDTVSPNCTISIVYIGSGDQLFQVADFSVVVSTNDYQISATFYHPVHGTVTINSAALVFAGCTNGMPSSGSVSFVSGITNGLITYTSCSTYNVVWDNGAGDTGSASGTWP